VAEFPQPVLWDVFAVARISRIGDVLVYGDAADLATLRDRAVTKLRRIAYGIASLAGAARTATAPRYEWPTCCSRRSRPRSC
jgi:molybdopterin-containing oxidoreductase family membrane subunit